MKHIGTFLFGLFILLWLAVNAYAQDEPKQDLSPGTVKTAKPGEVLYRRGSIEAVKADTALTVNVKSYTAPQWDMVGEPLVKFDEETGCIYAKSRYVQFVPDEETRKLLSSRDTGNTYVKEVYTIPDVKMEKMTWTVDTDADVRWDGETGTLTFTGFDGLYMFDSPPPTAWDAEKKPVEIEVKYADKLLTYTILPGLYHYPVTIDPTTTATAINTQSGYSSMYNEVYLTARNGIYGNTSSNYAVGQVYNGVNSYMVFRTFTHFSLPGMIACSACTLYVNGSSDNSTTDFTIHVYGARLYKPTLTGDDFKNFSNWAASGTYDSSKVMNNAWHSSSYSSAWNKIVFNSTGLDSMKAASGDTLWIALLSNRDVAPTTPTGEERIYFEYSTNTPYLSFTYSTTVVPTITTSSAASVRSTTATLGGNITATGGANATSRGIAYGASANPDTAGTNLRETGDFSTGTFTLPATGLSAVATYHQRAWATNSAGIAYGADSTFTTSAPPNTQRLMNILRLLKVIGSVR